MLESMVGTAFDPPFIPPLIESQPVRLLSRREYDRLVDLGWFVDEPIELLRGVLVTMSPQGWPHASAVSFFNEQLVLQLAGHHGVRPQLPFAADDWSEPEPDLVVVRKDPSLRGHPSEALLVVEIADSSLALDRGLKRTIYAEAGIPEYWIVDVNGRTVEIHTQPDGGRYSRVQTLRDGDVLHPTLLPGVAIWVAEIPR
jgi:Uma2 family endonuclease